MNAPDSLRQSRRKDAAFATFFVRKAVNGESPHRALAECQHVSSAAHNQSAINTGQFRR
jgi:hypothetical protein